MKIYIGLQDLKLFFWVNLILIYKCGYIVE